MDDFIASLAAQARLNLLPTTSQDRYMDQLAEFEEFLHQNSAVVSSDAILAYFQFRVNSGLMPSSLKTYMCMLKAALFAKRGFPTNDSTWNVIEASLKNMMKHHKKKKATVFTQDQLEKFVVDTENNAEFLTWNLALLIGLFSSSRPAELAALLNKDVTVENGTNVCIFIRRRKTDQAGIGKRYSSNVPADQWFSPWRFFNTYLAMKRSCPNGEQLLDPNESFWWQIHKGRVVAQHIGKNWFSQLPKKIAVRINAPMEGTTYSGYSIRRTSITWMAENGGTPQQLRTQGGWVSEGTANHYIDRTERIEFENSQRIFRASKIPPQPRVPSPAPPPSLSPGARSLVRMDDIVPDIPPNPSPFAVPAPAPAPSAIPTPVPNPAPTPAPNPAIHVSGASNMCVNVCVQYSSSESVQSNSDNDFVPASLKRVAPPKKRVPKRTRK
jgi:integrase